MEGSNEIIQDHTRLRGNYSSVMEKVAQGPGSPPLTRELPSILKIDL